MAGARGFRALAVAVTAGAALIVPPAGAVHWPHAGGDAGRSGFQPVDPGGLPITFAWERTADREVRTSIVTTAGGPSSTQRVVYGLEDGTVRVRVLLTGAAVGPGVDVSDAVAPFGSGAGSVTPVDTSTATALGQVFALHNDAKGVEIAQIDEATGTRARDDVQLTADGFQIQSSPVVTAPDGTGGRVLFFVADKAGDERLFRLPIANAASTAAAYGTVTSTGDIEATAVGSPTLVWLEDAGGTPTAYVAVGTNDGIKTYAVSDLSPGPTGVGVAGATRTPSTPVTASGQPPGAPGSGVTTAPAIYAASSDESGTRVHKWVQADDGSLTRTDSAVLPGEAAPLLAVGGGRVLVTTSANLYALSTDDLSVLVKLSATDLAAGSGFRFTSAAATGDVVAVVTDDGRQLVLAGDTLQPVAPELFTPSAAGEESRSSFGQPSISRRFLQMASDRGVFVYGMRRASPPTGYWLAASDGGIFAFGDAGFFGSTGALRLNRPIVGMAATPSREGYWLVASDGGIFAFGDAEFSGSTGALRLNSPVVGMAPTPTGLGYWLVAADGGVFSFGDAVFHGSTGALRLNSPIVGMAPTITGNGYWLVAADGGVFAFGDATFFGSTGALRLNSPIVGMAATPRADGYWLVAADGGLFAFGKAGFFGSTGALRLNRPIVGMGPSATGLGYLLTATDGGVFAFGDAPFLGSTGGMRLNRPVVGMAVKP